MGILKYFVGDLFQLVDEDNKEKRIVIPHVCNDKNKWGSGFVVPLGKKYPDAKEAYHIWHQGRDLKGEISILSTGDFLLGNIELVGVEDRVIVANMIAQTLGGKRPLFYNHLAKCMDSVAFRCKDPEEFKIIAPMFGSGLAGGDWKIIEKLVIDSWIRVGFDVTMCCLPGNLPEGFSPDHAPVI